MHFDFSEFTFSDWSMLAWIGGWLIRLAMIPVVVMRKEQPAACLAWLMIVFFEPWIGLLFYFLFGEDRLVRRRLKLRVRTAKQFRQAVDQSRSEFSPGPSSSADASDPETGEADWDVPADESTGGGDRTILHLLGESVGGVPVSYQNTISFITDTDDVVDNLIADIDAATCRIDLLFYIVQDDEVGRQVGDALSRAVQRGVRCRLLADSVGSRHFFRTLGASLRSRGIDVVEVLPVRLLKRSNARMDFRNHRKLAVIDGTIAWTGSQNIVEEGYGHRRAGVWHDIMARVTGPVVTQLQRVFLEDWYHETGQKPSEEELLPIATASGSVSIQVVPTGPDQPMEHFQHLLVAAIDSARHRVMITSPYFVPDEPLICALRLAAMRGVDVEVIIPRRSDHWLVDAAGLFYCGQLLKFGVRISRFQQGLLHSKTLTIDDSFGMIGSANYDIRSFYLNFELNISLDDPQAVGELVQIQQRYREQSTDFTFSEWQNMSRWKHLGCNIAKLFSPLL